MGNSYAGNPEDASIFQNIPNANPAISHVETQGTQIKPLFRGKKLQKKQNQSSAASVAPETRSFHPLGL